jgi:hypothetical protein
VILVASAAVIFGAFVIHANRAWFARELRYCAQGKLARRHHRVRR